LIGNSRQGKRYEIDKEEKENLEVGVQPDKKDWGNSNQIRK
jgi:hypothetical protein